MSSGEDVLALVDLPPGAQKVVEVGLAAVLLCHESGTGAIRAVLNECPHAFQPLQGGTVRQGAIQCPAHGACFDLASGAPLNAITSRPLQIFPVLIQSGRILVGRPT